MSTKTNFKRVALVAVAALGLGVLTSVAPANATVGATSGVTYSALSVCSDTTTATADSLIVPVGARIGLTLANTYYAQITGSSLVVTTIDDAVESLNTKGIPTFAAHSSGSSIVLSAVAVGSSNIVYSTGAATTSAAANTLYITVVAACTTSTISIKDSFVSLTDASKLAAGDTTWDTTKTNIDEAAVSTAGGSLYVRIDANNAYAAGVPAGVWSASATNGALVSMGGTVTTAPTKGTISVAVDATLSNAVIVRVAPKTAGVPQTSTVTVTYNGVTVATKNLTFYGEATKLNIVGGVSGLNGGSGYVLYALTDASGNKVPGSVSLDATTATPRVPSGANVYAAALTANTLSGTVLPVGVGVASYSCNAAYGSGTAALTFEHTNDVTEDDLTASVTASCSGAVDTYAVSMDKAAYKIGEIATMTITAKDSSAAAVSDQATVGTGATVSAGGMTQVGALATTDAFTGGKRTYTFQVTTAGTFNAVATIAGSTTKSATAAYSVAGGDVAMSEVLKAIVSLIASINKQIAALQKALLKK
jgi:hypothetical protein